MRLNITLNRAQTQSVAAQTDLGMKTVVILPATSDVHADFDVSFRRGRKRWLTALLAGSIAAIFTGVTGLVLAGASLLRVISPSGGLAVFGTILLAVTFPLLIFSAHCLDKIEDTNREQRMANLKQRIFTNSDRGLFK
jgi:hypothetical protein